MSTELAEWYVAQEPAVFKCHLMGQPCITGRNLRRPRTLEEQGKTWVLPEQAFKNTLVWLSQLLLARATLVWHERLQWYW